MILCKRLTASPRRPATPSLYVPGSQTKMSPERAYAAMLEENPDAYAAYRAQHSAAQLRRTLEAAPLCKGLRRVF